MKKSSLFKIVAVALIGTLFSSCMTTYTADGRPVQTVDPAAAAIGAVAVGAIAYNAGKDNRRHRNNYYRNNYYGSDYGGYYPPRGYRGY